MTALFRPKRPPHPPAWWIGTEEDFYDVKFGPVFPDKFGSFLQNNSWACSSPSPGVTSGEPEGPLVGGGGLSGEDRCKRGSEGPPPSSGPHPASRRKLSCESYCVPGNAQLSAAHHSPSPPPPARPVPGGPFHLLATTPPPVPPCPPSPSRAPRSPGSAPRSPPPISSPPAFCDNPCPPAPSAHPKGVNVDLVDTGGGGAGGNDLAKLSHFGKENIPPRDKDSNRIKEGKNPRSGDNSVMGNKEKQARIDRSHASGSTREGSSSVLHPAHLGSVAASRHQDTHDLPCVKRQSPSSPSASSGAAFSGSPTAKKSKMGGKVLEKRDLVVGMGGVGKEGAHAVKKLRADGGGGEKGGSSSSSGTASSSLTAALTSPSSSGTSSSACSSASRKRVKSGTNPLSCQSGRTVLQPTGLRAPLAAFQPQNLRDTADSCPSSESTAASSTAIRAQVHPPEENQAEESAKVLGKKSANKPSNTTRAKRRAKLAELAEKDKYSTYSSSASSGSQVGVGGPTVLAQDSVVVISPEKS